MGQQVSVETFTSTKDPDGNKYWTSFDPYPFKVGSKKLVYMGILNGEGPLKGQKCVVKTVRNGAISRSDWVLETKRSKIARSIADCYNKMVSSKDRKFTFNCPIMAEIDTMSDCLCINDILGKPKKKWKDSEHVSIELYLRGHFEEFEYGWVSPEELVETEAFSHFSWCRSEGSMLVSNLQGVKTAHAYHFTGPVIHSEDKDFGSSDMGYEGIKSFFHLHKCNQICREWPRLGDGVDLRGWGEYIAVGERFPTAPPLPPSYPFSPPSYTESAAEAVSTASEEEDIQEEETQLQRVEDNDRHATVSWQRSNQTFITPRFLQTACHERTAQWQIRNGETVYMDWQQAFVNQTRAFDSRYGYSNPVLQNEILGMQLMHIVKQMRYTIYAAPPPYCTCAEQRSEITQYGCSHRSGTCDKEQLLDDDDSNYLLPPPYEEEEYVDPETECITYL